MQNMTDESIRRIRNTLCIILILNIFLSTGMVINAIKNHDAFTGWTVFDYGIVVLNLIIVLCHYSYKKMDELPIWDDDIESWTFHAHFCYIMSAIYLVINSIISSALIFTFSPKWIIRFIFDFGGSLLTILAEKDLHDYYDD